MIGKLRGIFSRVMCVCMIYVSQLHSDITVSVNVITQQLLLLCINHSGSSVCTEANNDDDDATLLSRVLVL